MIGIPVVTYAIEILVSTNIFFRIIRMTYSVTTFTICSYKIHANIAFTLKIELNVKMPTTTHLFTLVIMVHPYSIY